MESAKSQSIFILKLIGTLFSVISIGLLGLIVWMLFITNEPGIEFKSFLLATGILNAATATIAIFIWWIISNKSKFLNYD